MQKILGKGKNNYYFSISDPSVLGQRAIVCFMTVASKASATVLRGGADPARKELGKIPGSSHSAFGWATMN